MQRVESWAKSRKYSIKDKRKTYLLYCGGDTEQLYFQGMKRNLGLNKNIEIIPVKMGGKDDLSILKKLLKEKKVRGKDELDNYYIIIDRDPGNNTEEQILETIRQSKANGVKPIINNVSIEVWFIMHFECFRRSGITVRKCMDILSDYMGCEYSKTDSDIYDKLKMKTIDAIKNAKRNEDLIKEDGNTPAFLEDPYTNMHYLMCDILELNICECSDFGE